MVAIISIVESCRRLDVPLKDYLPDVLPGLLNPGFAVRLLWNQDSVRAAWEQRIDQPACHMDQIRRDAVLEAIQEL